MSWTDERIDELRRLWAEGLSASQIATRLGGVTRNAVIGKIHRMGLSGRVKAVKPRAAAARSTSPRRQAPAAPRVMAVGSAAVKVVEREAPMTLPAAEVIPFGGGVSLLDLERGQCHWPLGDPSDDDVRFCGAACAPGQTYCAAHAERAFPGRARAKAKSTS